MNIYHNNKQRFKRENKPKMSIQKYRHKNTTFNIRINEYVKAGLFELAKKFDMSANDLADQLFRNALKENNIKIEPKPKMIYGQTWEL